LTLWPWFW